ncbi:MAG: cytochrome c oxidase assembly protein [Alphaproteobacteria bacterium]
MTSPSLHRRKIATVCGLFLILAVMTGLVAESVPLYRLFCKVTGYLGTTQVAEKLPKKILDRVVTVRFNADVGNNMPWTFVAPQPMKVRIGERGLAFFTARNDTDHAITGSAVYNVTPGQAGPYFDKIACFCFRTQTLAARQEAEMPVSFFVDPAIVKDPDAGQIDTITLSYTFYAVPDATSPAQASSNIPTATVN